MECLFTLTTKLNKNYKNLKPEAASVNCTVNEMIILTEHLNFKIKSTFNSIIIFFYIQ